VDILAHKRSLYVLFLMFFGGLGGILYGYDIGVISGALVFMKPQLLLTDNQISLLVAAVLGGGAFATLIAGFIANKIGRKATIFISSIIFLVGLLIIVDAHSYTAALIGRLVQGAGIGIEMIILPLYLAETAPSPLRGRFVVLFQLFLTFGIVLAYTIDLFFTPSGNWRSMFACVFIPGILLLVGTFYISESPRWLYLKQEKDKALNALLRTHTPEEAKHDLKQMADLEAQKNSATYEQTSVLKKQYLLPFFIALSIACLGQLTGINSVLQFGTLILQNSGAQSNMLAMVGTVGIGLLNMITTVVALLLIDKVGRKLLLSIGTGGLVCSLIFLAVVSMLGTNSLEKSYLILAGLLAYIMFFAIGPGVVVWLAISELMPTRIRSSGMSICLFANSLVSAILASGFMILVQHIHYSGTFFFCAAFTVIYFLIAVFVLPETKNKTLEDIETHFRHKAGIH
jgi:MFS transporter, SP family, galactose:H+ symporter